MLVTTFLQSNLIEILSKILPENMRSESSEAAIGLALIFLISAIVHIFIRVWIIRLLTKFDEKTESDWYAILLRQQLPQRALFMIPLLIIYNGLELVPEFHEDLTSFILRITAAMMILVGARVFDAFLSSIHSLYQKRPDAHLTPIKSYIQLGKVLVYVLAGFFIISSLADKSPWYFLSGIGAIMAIILLLFRDTLLSLVASVQLTSNDLIRVGDWIDMPQFDANGDVIDIALNTVRVQNWDKTISVIPTHKFLEHSFRNWRGMQESGGRRVMRSIKIDISTVRFLTFNEIQKLKKSHLLSKYMEEKMMEIGEYNEKHLKGYTSTLTNGRWLTNIGTFRRYVIEYLKNHPNARQDMTMIVRQLEATETGLPLQIYFFTNTTAWVEYEGIQSDVFDHLLAIAPEFGLKIYQQPTGYDLRELKVKEEL
ncbi:mechanosensitive ion channel family protein [Rhodohalobacter sp.]|uniref:mechanosensitive ion channel family protein n=1 Tax=Rhodohalobacter sp. TaxID=1974210 RepID=UPI002ACE4D45|nr:mechanosensitive ion channel family protein [Rhodohalobacter sp.]MDZ7756797.1 mechanosensitive ion channel family protein [Rhodohalobacter sp.]